MISIENECVDCGLPCLYESCPYWAVKRYYCDECEEEKKLFYFNGREMCLDCIEQELEVVT